MTVTDKIKILDRKIKQNEAQYHLDTKAAKILTLSSRNLDKYEYQIGEDLNYKTSIVDQAKCDYSPLSKFFDKGLKEKDKKEGLLKRLKSIESKSKEQLKATKTKNENIKEVTDFVEEPVSLEEKALIEEIIIMQRDVDYRKLQAVTVIHIILVIIKHLKSYLETFIMELQNKQGRTKTR